MGIAGEIRVLKVVEGIDGRGEGTPGLFFQPSREAASLSRGAGGEDRENWPEAASQDHAGLLPPGATSSDQCTASAGESKDDPGRPAGEQLSPRRRAP